MVKITNPLNYPLAVLGGGICLFLGVRIMSLSSFLVIPASISFALITSTILAQKSSENSLNLENKSLENELRLAKKEAQVLITKSENLRLEAKNLLRDSWQMDLLTAVEYVCDRTLELPQQIEDLTRKLSGGDSLLSVEELEKKLEEVKKKQKQSDGLALNQLRKMESSINNNIILAKRGQSARQAQVFALINLITESEGILQELQNKLRTSDLNNSQTLNDLQELTNELSALLI